MARETLLAPNPLPGSSESEPRPLVGHSAAGPGTSIWTNSGNFSNLFVIFGTYIAVQHRLKIGTVFQHRFSLLFYRLGDHRRSLKLIKKSVNIIPEIDLDFRQNYRSNVVRCLLNFRLVAISKMKVLQ